MILQSSFYLSSLNVMWQVVIISINCSVVCVYFLALFNPCRIILIIVSAHHMSALVNKSNIDKGKHTSEVHMKDVSLRL